MVKGYTKYKCKRTFLVVTLLMFVLMLSACGEKNERTRDNSVSDSNIEDEKEENADTEEFVMHSTHSSSINTGDLSEAGDGYEGIPGTGNYNYGEALQKSLIFYELQRSGDIPDETRCNWRGDSALMDGSDVGLDLTGGWYDAGDNVKFNLPMAYSASMLGWSLYEDWSAYEESGQLEYALGNIRWANDYFMKCHPEDNVYYYQVGNGSMDHTWWGPAECVEIRMERPSYYVDSNNPGSAVAGEAAASLAICSIVYENVDPEYSKLCLEHAKSLYAFADSTRSDAGYTAAAGFYDSWSGFYDELAWAGAWLYIATDDKDYLTNAEACYKEANQDYIWSMCWDDVHIGAAVMLARLTGDSQYKDAVEQHLDWWTTGTAEGERINYTPKGLAWLDNWGSLRYATTTGFVALVYGREDYCPERKKEIYHDFALSQADYALGSTGRSFMIGFGEDYPVHPHHRTAQGSYMDNMNEPGVSRHTLYGALVGGPDASDGYSDEVSNYNNNEVACDYNAGFTGLLAGLYSEYHGETLINFGAVEEIDANEFYAESSINVDGEDFIELRTFVYNESAWPARVASNLELRYFIDLSEIVENGYSPADIEITTNYMQGGNVEGIKTWDEDNNIYYLSVTFDDALLYPGGQEQYKKELQIRLKGPGIWDNSNDPSYSCLNGNTLAVADTFALYEEGELIFGSEPAAGDNPGRTVNTTGHTGNNNNNSSSSQMTTSSNTHSTATNESVSVKMDYSNTSQSISGTIDITNNSDGSLSLSDIEIQYYFTNDDNKGITFSCYHSAINGASGNYTGLNNVKGEFKKVNGENTDTVCIISFGDSQVIDEGDTLTVNFCINYDDWSNWNSSNDYSAQDIENIVISCNGKIIFGNKP